MGLYSVFLGLGQIIGSILGGVAAELAGLDGIFVVSFVLLGIALLPLSHLRRYEHRFGDAARADCRRGRPMPDAEPPAVPARLVRGARGAVVAPHHLATAGRAVGPAPRAGSAVDAAIATNAVLAVVMPNGCGLGGDAFWLIWDEAAGEQVALNGSGRAPAGADAAALRASGPRRALPLRGPLSITVPGAVRSWGDAHRRWGRLSREAVLAPAIELAEGGFPAWDGLIAAVEAARGRGGRASRGAGVSR